MEAGNGLPPFPTAAGAITEGTDPAVESSAITRGQVKQGGDAGSAVEGRHTEGLGMPHLRDK